MSTLTVVTSPQTRPAPGRRPTGPVAGRPALAPRHVVSSRPTACTVRSDEPTWQLTQRGLVVVMSLLAAVMGSAVITCIVAFLSVSNAPL